jgi:ribonuclease BN (tRNA processing enzyme)
MKLVVLGSGTANPHPRRSSPAFWLEVGAQKVMLDFGASALHRLSQEGLDWPNLDAVWISHFHLDHCCGLPAYLFATRHSPDTRDRKKPLRLIGGPGFRRLIDRFDQVNNYKLLEQPFPVEIVEVEPLERFSILPGVEAIAMSTPHNDESMAIRFEDEKGTVLVYTSDTGFGKEAAAFAREVDLFIIESSFFRDKKTDIHLELAEAIYLIRKARPRRAMLTHFYAEWDGVDFASEVVRLEPKCEVIEAVDGLVFNFAKETLEDATT